MKLRDIMKILAVAALSGAAAFAQTAGQDAKRAGNDTKNAAKDAGQAVKHGAKTTGRKVKHVTHKAAQGAANKTR